MPVVETVPPWAIAMMRDERDSNNYLQRENARLRAIVASLGGTA